MNQNLCSVLLKKSCLNLQKLFHSSGIYFQNHYETLKLQRNCTSKDIRESFIKLSKENHPDVNKDPNAHKEFLKIQEAYNVLSKSTTRTSYDLGLANPHYSYDNDFTHVRSTRSGMTGETNRNHWDERYFYNRARPREQYEEHPYYGIRGINKVSNGFVATIVILLAFTAFLGQMMAINYSFTLQRDKMLRRSEETQETLNEIQARAHRNGREMQVEILRRHFEEVERQREKLRGPVE